MSKSFSSLILLLALSLVTASGQKLSPRTAIIADRTVSQRSLSAEGTTVSAYIYANPASLDREALARLGVQIDLDLGDMLTARMPLSALASLPQVGGVDYVQASAPARPMLDIVRGETAISSVNEGSTPYTGQGVVVGIVDAGFDYNHAAFRASDGTLRIRRVWEQGTTPHDNLSSPALFNYGTEFTTPEDIEAAGGDIRNNSHGTHVACCAAGSSSHADGSLRGMAPDADIVLVSMLEAGAANVNITNGIAYIFNYANEVNKPCVVNLSLGANIGPHDGSSPFDLIADRLQGPGRVIVGAAGNFRANGFHIHRDRLAQPLSTFIAYTTAPSASNRGEVELWTDAAFSAHLVLYKLSTCEEVTRAAIPLEPTATVSLGRNVTGSFATAYELNPGNKRHHLLLTSEVTAIRSGYAIAIELTPAEACTLDIRADGTDLGLTSNNKEGFAAPTAEDATICEIGGTARRITTVGAYTTRADYQLLGASSMAHLPETVGTLCSFSSCGPTDDGRVKPDVTAPGAFIKAAVSQFDASGTIFLADVQTVGSKTHSYGFMQGTSMASPIVAGIVACWLQACPELTPELIAQALAATSRHDEATELPPSNRWGYGKIDALAGLRECQLLANGVVTASENDSDAPLYNLAGQRVGNSAGRGLYIQKGKKTVR